MTHETLMPVDAMEASKTPENLERYRLINIGSIAIFGEEGAGKSNLSEALAQALNARLLGRSNCKGSNRWHPRDNWLFGKAREC